MTLYAKPGQKVAFVGSTGAGKTTITNLINRFYDIADGKIRYDGININKIKKADLRRSLGVVLQDTNLFTGTVMDNIRYGRLDACDEECIAAAKLAGAHDFITRLPQGYDTPLSGQRRKPVPGPKTAAGHCPCGGGGPARDDPGRGDQLHRHPHRGHCTTGHGRADDGPHGVCHRTPAEHCEKRRRHHGAGPRTLIERGTHDELLAPEGDLLPALYRRAGTGLKRCGKHRQARPASCGARLLFLQGGRCLQSAVPGGYNKMYLPRKGAVLWKLSWAFSLMWTRARRRFRSSFCTGRHAAARGRVDSGDTCLDHDVIERSRGITVFADEAAFTACGLPFRLIDTPGHADFSGEMERSTGPWTARYWW